MGQTRMARRLSQESKAKATVEHDQELWMATPRSLRRTQASKQPRPRKLQRRVDMVAVAPESRRCLSSRVSAWRPRLLNLSKKKREEKRLPTREKPLRKIQKGSKKAIILRHQRQSGPKTPAWRC